VQYLCTGIYNGSTESGILWSDPEIAIQWPIENPVLSPKDQAAQTLREWLLRREAKKFAL
jgi:dTDP-4-dehydrorhamnose 3,5-epimerase